MIDLIGGITPREYLHGIVIGNIVPNQTELLAVLKWADETIRILSLSVGEQEIVQASIPDGLHTNEQSAQGLSRATGGEA